MTPNRREFLRSAARYGVAGLVVLGGASLVARGGECRKDAPCDRCGEFAGCGLEKAAAARRERQPEAGAKNA